MLIKKKKPENEAKYNYLTPAQLREKIKPCKICGELPIIVKNKFGGYIVDPMCETLVIEMSIFETLIERWENSQEKIAP